MFNFTDIFFQEQLDREVASNIAMNVTVMTAGSEDESFEGRSGATAAPNTASMFA